jgi:diaminohydroxyphosphoribosylaminopyrimidine deaminase/5-amino-6-(5-phosphoribosylamino)uracil reductase
MLQKDDRDMLARALNLAARGGAAVAPNPRVGAIITRDDETVAEGYHAAYGGPHAEAVALERAGTRARGATLYCNLEPCSYSAPDKHNGACTNLIIAAGVARVVVGQLDPNPRVRGGGVAALRAAGVEVETPDDFDDVWYENAAFNTTAALARPFVTLKLAQSLDGKIATVRGDSKWITDEEARDEVHALRARNDAVLVGVGTVVADDPRLTVRSAAGGSGAGQPRAVVLDPSARLPLQSQLVRNRAAELTVLVAEAPRAAGGEVEPGVAARIAALRERGITVFEVESDTAGRLQPAAALQALWEDGVRSVLVEGGGGVATSFLAAALFDALRVYVAPRIIGGDGVGIDALGVESISQAVSLEKVRTRTLGEQAVIEGFRAGWLESVQTSVREEAYVHGTG